MQKYGKKKPTDARHIRLYYAMMDSPAYRALSDSAKVVFNEFLREWGGKDQNSIILTYSTVQERTTRAPATIAHAILELEAFGFIDRKEPGGLHNRATVYALSERWKEVSKDPQKLEESKRRVKAHR